MSKKRFMTLAGILTESALSEAPTAPGSGIDESIEYFKKVRNLMSKLLNASIAAARKVTDEDSAIELADVFGEKVIDLELYDSSFEDFSDWWSNEVLLKTRRVIREKNDIVEAYQDLKRTFIPLCDGVISRLTEYKTKGASATQSDKSKARRFFTANANKVLDIDNSLETWVDWCKGNLFRGL